MTVIVNKDSRYKKETTHIEHNIFHHKGRHFKMRLKLIKFKIPIFRRCQVMRLLMK